MWQCVPAVLDTWEADTGGFLEPRNVRAACTTLSKPAKLPEKKEEEKEVNKGGPVGRGIEKKRNPHTMLLVVAEAQHWGARQAGPWGSLASQPCLLNKLLTARRPFLKTQGRWLMRSTWAVSPGFHTTVHTQIYVQKCTKFKYYNIQLWIIN